MTIISYRFKTIQDAKDLLYTEKKSKFYAYAFPIESIDDIEVALMELKKKHHKARHHCYAYRLGLDKNLYRANDDGEPSGTAGKPILGQIDSKNLTNTLIVVVRYFGGVKLGASGLGTAYKIAAKGVLDLTQIVEKEIRESVRIRTDHETIGRLMSSAKSLGWNINHTDYSEAVTIILEGPKTDFDLNLFKLKAKTLNISLQQAKEISTPLVFHILQSEKEKN